MERAVEEENKEQRKSLLAGGGDVVMDRPECHNQGPNVSTHTSTSTSCMSCDNAQITQLDDMYARFVCKDKDCSNLICLCKTIAKADSLEMLGLWDY